MQSQAKARSLLCSSRATVACTLGSFVYGKVGTWAHACLNRSSLVLNLTSFVGLF